jgi:hypothetical protein
MADSLTTFMCRLSRNSGSLNLLEPKMPVAVCNGLAYRDYGIFIVGVQYLLNVPLFFVSVYRKD